MADKQDPPILRILELENSKTLQIDRHHLEVPKSEWHLESGTEDLNINAWWIFFKKLITDISTVTNHKLEERSCHNQGSCRTVGGHSYGTNPKKN